MTETERPVDLDLGGRAVVRLVDARAADVARVRRQLGPVPAVADGDDRRGTTPTAPAGRAPDVTIRFVDRLVLEGPIRRLGAGAIAVGSSFVATIGGRKTPVRVAIPMATLGLGPAEIVVERTRGSIPLLLPILAVSLLARGVAPVHASAFLDNGRGVLVSGWAKGGKSETLLAFLRAGATYVGDEWLFLDPDGPQMFGTPEPIRLWDWQLAMVPELTGGIGRGRRGRLAVAAGVARALHGTSDLPVVGRTSLGEASRRVGSIVERQRSIQIPVHELVGSERVSRTAVPIDRVVLVTAGDTDRVTLDLPPSETAARIAATTAHELLDLSAARLAFRHAVPSEKVDGIEDLEGRLRAALEPILADVPIIELEHRHPPDIPGLRPLLAPALEAPPRSPGGPAVPHEGDR